MTDARSHKKQHSHHSRRTVAAVVFADLQECPLEQRQVTVVRAEQHIWDTVTGKGNYGDTVVSMLASPGLGGTWSLHVLPVLPPGTSVVDFYFIFLNKPLANYH